MATEFADTAYKSGLKAKSASSRFLMTSKKLLVEQKKTLAYFIAGYLGICLVIGLWFSLMARSAAGEAALVLYILFAGLVCAIVASKMFSDLTSKEGRISLLMTPASPAEKYFPRLILVLPGMLLLVALGYVVLDYATILACGLAYGKWYPFFNPFAGATDSSDWFGIYMLFSMFLFNEAIFIFGAVAWPRKSFLKSVGVFVVIQILFSSMLPIVVKSGFSFTVEADEALGWTLTSLVTLLSAAIVGCSYFKFKKTTVI